MGSPLSPIIADLVMEDLECKALERFETEGSFYFRYDIVTDIPNYLIEEFLRVFNSFHSRLQFTLEVGCGRLNFLDVMIIKANGKLEFNIYHKLTFSGTYLNFFVSSSSFTKERYSYEHGEQNFFTISFKIS